MHFVTRVTWKTFCTTPAQKSDTRVERKDFTAVIKVLKINSNLTISYHILGRSHKSLLIASEYIVICLSDFVHDAQMVISAGSDAAVTSDMENRDTQ